MARHVKHQRSVTVTHVSYRDIINRNKACDNGGINSGIAWRRKHNGVSIKGVRLSSVAASLISVAAAKWRM